MKYKQTSDDLNLHFEEQMGFLQKSCLDYDSGDVTEAKRIAQAIRVLLHDTNSSTSSLGHLGTKDKIPFYSSYMPSYLHPNARQAIAHLVGMDFIQGKFIPFYDTNRAQSIYVNFDSWWNMTVLCSQD